MDAVWKTLYMKAFPEPLLDLRNLFDGDSEVKIQGDHWFRISIDRLPSSHAVLHLVLVQQLNQRFEQISAFLLSSDIHVLSSSLHCQDIRRIQGNSSRCLPEDNIERHGRAGGSHPFHLRGSSDLNF